MSASIHLHCSLCLFFFFNFIYGCAGSSLLCGLFFSLVAESGGCSVVAMHGLLIAVASPVAKLGL